MRIVNKTKNTVLAVNAVLADTPFTRIKGLLGKKALKEGEALIIKPGNSIHTFFMYFPIDVLFLDKNNRVIAAIASLKPFRFSPVYFRAIFVLELPADTIQSTSTQKDDTISFE